MPAKPFTFFEHQYRTYAELGLSPAEPRRFETLLAGIERVNRAAGQVILHPERKGLRAAGLVGMVRVGDAAFEILPKLDSAARPHPEGAGLSATRALLVMLSYTAQLPVLEMDALPQAVQEAPWPELLTHLFAAGLYRQALSGIDSQYVTQEETLPVLRGRWALQRQVQRRGHDGAPFDVRFDTLSPDHPLNQVFRYVVERLAGISGLAENRALLAALLDWLQPVTCPASLPAQVLESIRFNRLNERFQPSFHLARLFLAGQAVRPGGAGPAVSAYVFDMHVLFEGFVTGFLQAHRRRILPPGWQDAELTAQAAGRRIYLAHREGRPAFRLRPDLLFYQKGQPEPLLVADCKYKNLAGGPQAAARRQGLEQEDVYQMLAYAVRLGSPRALLLYPQPPRGGTVRERYRIEPAACELFAASIDLGAPLDPPDHLIAELRDILTWIAGD